MGSRDPGAAGGGRQRPRGAVRGLRAHLCPLPRRLLQQLEVAKSSKAALGKSPAKAPMPTGDAVTFELYWKPEQEQFAQTAKVSVERGAHCA